MPKTTYVTCIVSQGIFESEFYVSVKDSSAYVDRVNVQVEESPSNGDQVKGRVVAYIVEEKDNEALIELPGEPVVGGLPAWVPKTDLAFV
jgi:hypothetical protein